MLFINSKTKHLAEHLENYHKENNLKKHCMFLNYDVRKKLFFIVRQLDLTETFSRKMTIRKGDNLMFDKFAKQSR